MFVNSLIRRGTSKRSPPAQRGTHRRRPAGSQKGAPESERAHAGPAAPTHAASLAPRTAADENYLHPYRLCGAHRAQQPQDNGKRPQPQGALDRPRTERFRGLFGRRRGSLRTEFARTVPGAQ